MSNKRWQLKPLEEETVVGELQVSLNNLPFPLARALALRGVDSTNLAKAFFRSGTEELHDPYLMKDMTKAVDRIVLALDKKESICVYGDYDVDGTTSTALLTHYLTSLGADVAFFVPDRFKHGYGLSELGLKEVAEMGTKLVVSLDCGITSVHEAEFARTLGMDLIICDHHTPGDIIPDAIAVLDAKQADCPYPFKELCGCAVTMKLAQAIQIKLGKDPQHVYSYLDLVGIATASDVVSLTGENRILLREGIKQLKENPRVGLKMLAEQANVRLSECDTRSIVFNLGPRINAAGRLGDAARAVTLLLSETELEGTARARQLERLNEERRALDRQTQIEAFKMADLLLAKGQRHTVVLHHPEWHLGVIGIVASRLVDRHFRPAVMLANSGDMVKGSARSINGINIYNALQSCSELLEEFGGHDYAAGVSLRPENVEAFIERFDKAVAASVTPDILEPVVEVDSEMTLSDLDTRFWAVLKQFEPFGADNPSPIFWSSQLEVVGPVATVGKDRSHLKFSVRERAAGQPARDVIGFGLGKHLSQVAESQERGKSLDLLFSIQENTFNGRTKLQLLAKDVRLNQG
ncbi:single-stranded-DNA-specific exonuclease RecJ [bacterium]|nr:single-stranded-DNA-specific exonuclease RecJ [bacterium]